MQLVNVTAERAEAALLALARHVPKDVHLGRPLVAIVLAGSEEEVQLLSEGLVTWAVEEDVGMVSRLLPVGDEGLVELTRWMDGHEMQRSVGRPRVLDS